MIAPLGRQDFCTIVGMLLTFWVLKGSLSGPVCTHVLMNPVLTACKHVVCGSCQEEFQLQKKSPFSAGRLAARDADYFLVNDPPFLRECQCSKIYLENCPLGKAKATGGTSLM